ncbi:MAG: hypothetical protein J5822_08745 [Eubacteriaceae bacterium]|nr:hypothetical protein [Eubacteriaceae bacterium]
MGIFTGKRVLLSDSQEAALRAVEKERNTQRLLTAANRSGYYRVRAAACARLGMHQKAAYEIALHDPDEAECLRALEETDWSGQDALLSDIAAFSSHPSVAIRALEKLESPDVIARAAVSTKDTEVALRALELLSKDRHFELVASESSDPRVVERALGGIHNPKTLAKLLSRSPKIAAVARERGGSKIISAVVTGELAAFCCPDGRFHDFEEKKEWHDLGYSDDDDMKARRGYYTVEKKCRNCGYTAG